MIGETPMRMMWNLCTHLIKYLKMCKILPSFLHRQVKNNRLCVLNLRFEKNSKHHSITFTFWWWFTTYMHTVAYYENINSLLKECFLWIHYLHFLVFSSYLHKWIHNFSTRYFYLTSAFELKLPLRSVWFIYSSTLSFIHTSWSTNYSFIIYINPFVYKRISYPAIHHWTSTLALGRPFFTCENAMIEISLQEKNTLSRFHIVRQYISS